MDLLLSQPETAKANKGTVAANNVSENCPLFYHKRTAVGEPIAKRYRPRCRLNGASNRDGADSNL